jgi:hypothetical protein
VSAALAVPMGSDALGSDTIVPIELLAPDPGPSEAAVLPFEAWIDGPSGPVPVVPIQALAPDGLSHPEKGSQGPAGPGGVLDDFKDWLDNLP